MGGVVFVDPPRQVTPVKRAVLWGILTEVWGRYISMFHIISILCEKNVDSVLQRLETGRVVTLQRKISKQARSRFYQFKRYASKVHVDIRVYKNAYVDSGWFISANDLKKVMAYLIQSSKMSQTHKGRFMDVFKLRSVHLPWTRNARITCVESDTMLVIMKCTASLHGEREQSIGPYRVDLVYRTYKHVVECDEKGHCDRDHQAECRRHNYLLSQGYTITRYNPDAPGFDIYAVVNIIWARCLNVNKTISS